MTRMRPTFVWSVPLAATALICSCVSSETPILGTTPTVDAGDPSKGDAATTVDAGDAAPTGDAGCTPTTGAACNQCAPFGAPVEMAYSGSVLSGFGEDFGGRVARGDLFFSSNRGGGGSYVLYRATLTGATSTGSPLPIATFAEGGPVIPAVTADGGALVYTRGAFTARQLYRAALAGQTLTGEALLFGPTAQPGSGQEDADPHVVEQGGALTSVYYTSTRGDASRRRIYRTSGTGINLSVGDALPAPVNDAAFQSAAPWVSPDELELWFSRQPFGTSDPYQVVTTRRASPTAAFAPPTPLRYVDGSGTAQNVSGFVAWVSPDGCAMHLVRQPGLTRVVVLRKPPL